REIDAGVGAHEPMLGLAHDEIAAPAENAHRLLFDQLLVRERVVGIDLDEATLRLGHDLLCHHDNVTVTQVVGSSDDYLAKHVARPDLADAVDRNELDGHRSMTSLARAAASAGPCMIVGATTQRTPSASTLPACSASASSITSVETNGA